MHKLFALFCCLFLASCNSIDEKPPILTEFTGNAMTINYRVLIGDKLSDAQIEQIESIIHTTFHETDQHLNRWNPASELSHLNRLPKEERLKLSSTLYNFLLNTADLVKLTEGKFDPSVETLAALWKTRLAIGAKPSDEEIKDLLKTSGFHHLHFEEGSVWKDFTETAFDLGGIAKGYTVDEISTALSKNGYRNHYVEWGGEIRASGKHPGNRAWRVYIAGLDSPSPNSAIETLELYNQALATSGDYLQNWKVDGKLYTHILNPATGEPLEIKKGSVASATVLASDCETADALATAIFLFDSPIKLEEWLKRIKNQHPELLFWVIYR